MKAISVVLRFRNLRLTVLIKMVLMKNRKKILGLVRNLLRMIKTKRRQRTIEVPYSLALTGMT